MKIGDYDVKLSPLGWLAAAAAAMSGAFAPGKGFRSSREGNSEMAHALHVYIVNPDDERIYVEHIFYGDTKADAATVKREHLASCEYFRAAQEEGRTDEWEEQIPEEDLPSIDGGGEDDD